MNAQTAYSRVRHLPLACSAALIAVALLMSACGDVAGERGETWQRQGQLLAWDRDVWIVDATPIVVPASLVVDGEQVLGSLVTAEGEYDDEGRLVAQAVTLTHGSLPNATLEEIEHEGLIASTSAAVWVVGGRAVLLPDGVTIEMAEGVEQAALASGEYVATVKGHGFGENTIVASAITVVSAREQDGNAAPVRPAVTVERRDQSIPAQPEAPAPEPEPADNAPVPESPSRPDDDDDDKGEKKQDKKDREQREKDDKGKDKGEKDD